MSNSILHTTPKIMARDFQIFEACAQHGSYLKAAHKLGIQQSGLSKVILKLEADLGQTLFYRTPRGVTLTEYGSCLREALRKTEAAWGSFYNTEIHQNFGNAGLVRLGFHSSVAANMAPSFLSALLKNFPLARFEMEFHSSLETTRRVADLQLDMGIVVNAVSNPALVIQKLSHEYVAPWFSGGKPEKVLLVNPAMFKLHAMLKKFKDYRVQEIADYEVIASIIQRNKFVGLLPNIVASRYGLQQMSDKLMTVEIGLICHKEKLRTPLFRSVATAIVKELRAR